MIDINQENTVGHKLYAALRLLHKAQWQQAIEGNKPSEMTLMICISRYTQYTNEGLKVSDLSRLMKLTAPTVTQLINSLEAKNMVERRADPFDRRAVRVSLTEQGQAVTEKARRFRNEQLSNLVDYLGEEDCNQLAELLLKVHTFTQNHPVYPGELPLNGDEKA